MPRYGRKLLLEIAMFWKRVGVCFGLSMLCMTGAANAVTLKISASSASVGGLGYFIVDDSVFTTTTALVASQFDSYFFSDPISGITLDKANVTGDTGVTFFGSIGGVWTVTGGGGDSLTDSVLGNALWIAGSSFVSFRSGGPPAYGDVSWSTADYISSTPVPSALPLFVTGLSTIGLFGWRRKKKTARVAA
jgi:hypothetical protein